MVPSICRHCTVLQNLQALILPSDWKTYVTVGDYERLLERKVDRKMSLRYSGEQSTRKNAKNSSQKKALRGKSVADFYILPTQRITRRNYALQCNCQDFNDVKSGDADIDFSLFSMNPVIFGLRFIHMTSVDWDRRRRQSTSHDDDDNDALVAAFIPSHVVTISFLRCFRSH